MLAPNHPNPYDGTTSLRCTSPRAGMVEIGVFDLAGRGVHSIRREFAAGVYMTPIHFADEVVTGGNTIQP